MRRGLAESRSQAQRFIDEGIVLVSGTAATKPATMVDATTPLVLRDTGEQPFASRGGHKLAGALDAFGYDPAGRRARDAGASTGGFTDVLLQRGAARVVALDVGYGQLAEKLRQDPRVVNMERTHVGKLPPSSLQPAPTVAVIDVSFISLAQVLPHVVVQLAPSAGVVALIKPQFEVGRAHVGKGGIVRDEEARKGAVDKVLAAARALGLDVQGVIDSPITGADGNVEHLALLTTSGVSGTRR